MNAEPEIMSPRRADWLQLRAGRPDELPTLLEIDDDATRLYMEHGVALHLADSDPFVEAERSRWAAALAEGDVALAEDAAGQVFGMAVLMTVDGAPYLDQLSVRRASMRRGIGGALLAHSLEWARARGRALWLTTYSHLPWNRPFYERRGFACVDESEWGTELRALVADQRSRLPSPEERVAMRART